MKTKKVKSIKSLSTLIKLSKREGMFFNYQMMHRGQGCDHCDSCRCQAIS
jgi:hypothetical protein